MTKIPGFTFLAVILLFSCNSVKVKTEQESYQFTKAELLKKEEKNPVGFLTVTGNNKRNLVGQTVIRGEIHNSATIAVFKDIDIKLSFYSKTKALLETDQETVFEQIDPGATKDFKTKYFAPKGTDSVALEVLSAKVVAQP